MRSKKALANIIASFSLQAITIICGLIVPRLIIGTFGSSVNGLIASINQFLGFIVFFEAGIGGVTRAALYKPLAQKDIEAISGIIKATEKFFRIIAAIFVGYLLVISLFFPQLVSNDFSSTYVFSLIVIIGISTFVQYFFGMSYQILLGADQRQYFNSALQIITTIINSTLTIALIKLGASIHLVKIVSAIVFVIRPVILNFYVKKKYYILKKCSADNNAIKQRWDGLGHHIAFLLRSNSDIVILTLFTNTKEISVYSVYFMIVSGIQNIVTTFSTGLEAAFGNMIAKDEKETLSKNFRIFEFTSFTLTTIFFTSTALLILPFISLYTTGISDVNYLRPEFAYVLVAAQAIYCIRIPYNSVVLAAGHYKQTRNGAFVEAFINVGASVLFVYFFGLIGVAVGTLCAMLFRTIQYAMYLSKNILYKSVFEFIKRMAVSVISCMCIVLIVRFIPFANIDTYIRWVIYAIIVVAIASFVTLLMGAAFYLSEMKNLFEIAKRAIKRRSNEQEPSNK